jgi:hypothetical protein
MLVVSDIECELMSAEHPIRFVLGGGSYRICEIVSGAKGGLAGSIVEPNDVFVSSTIVLVSGADGAVRTPFNGCDSVSAIGAALAALKSAPLAIPVTTPK